ncbi:cyclic nucleotide-binding domain-containing protein [Rhodoligotrophos defluvii]|uniref:cyclic nucleotide-binding domain-containing protein n=1 Tax=Rhodoligotrophos defluvii TaxID=2561934 RepID=UPI0010C95014|nr:cyclic nucleotide-binding domain-containing protein [Rhodoligotrophos defluvii]
MSVRARVELLRRIPLFSDAADAHLQLLGFAMDTETFAPGDAIIARGERGQKAYIIETGTARVTEPDQLAEDSSTLVGPGACLGESAMVADLPYSLTAIAQTDVRCLRLTRELFYRVAEEFPDFAELVLSAVSRRLDESVRDLREVESAFRRAKSFSSL